MADLQRIAKWLWISSWSFWNTEEYDGIFASADSSEENVCSVMSWIQAKVNNAISYLWGQTVRPFSMGARQLRLPSVDIDAVIHSLDALRFLFEDARKNNNPFFLHFTGVCFFTVLNWLPISLQYQNVYGIPIDKYRDTIEFDTNEEKIQFIKPELLSALKTRRRTKDGNMRPKDTIDIWNLILASRQWKIEFNPRRYGAYNRLVQWSMDLHWIQNEMNQRDNFTEREKRKLRGFFYWV